MEWSDAPSTRLHANGGSRASDAGEATPTVALGISGTRNRKLLEELLSEFELTEVSDPIPAGTDLCIVDTETLRDLRGALEAWKASQRPATAPVLLLATEDATEVWQRYGDTVGGLLKGIQSIPAPRRAILSRVEALLETRRHSVIARQHQETLELYKRAMDGALIGISIADATDPELPLTYVNEGFCRLTGYESEEVLGRNCRFLQGPETDEATVGKIRAALDAEAPVSVEIRNYRESGELFWNALDIMPVQDDDGETSHFLGFQQDITERKQREQLLEQYEQILHSVEDPIFVLDGMGKVIETNDAAEAVFGTDGSIPAGGSAPRPFSDEQAARWRETVDAVRESGESRSEEFRTSDTQRDSTVFQFRFQRLTLSSGSDERIIAVGRDITRIREYQDRLSVLDRILRHNLRNKLNIASGKAQIVAEEAEELSAEEVTELATSIDTAAKTLLELADAARRFSRSIDPAQSEKRVVELADLVREVSGELRETYPSAEIDVRASNSRRAVCPSTIRLCIEQLVDNAVQHSDADRPWVGIEVDHEDPEWVELRVSDNGCGFPDVERRALIEGSETPMEHVQGVSLWLIRWAVTNAGGRLDIRDRPEGGATVVLRFPRAWDWGAA